MTSPPPPITGASVVLVETYNCYRSPKRTGTAFILFRDRNTEQYAEAGGRINGNESAESCAQRELREESLGLFRIDIGKLKQNQKLELSTFRNQHKAFAIHVTGPPRMGIRRDDYHFNKRVLDKIRKRVPVPIDWQETDDMTRIYAYDWKVAISNAHTNQCVGGKDVYGNYIIINHRTVSLLANLIRSNPSLTTVQLNANADAVCDHGLGTCGTKLRKGTVRLSKCLWA